MRQMQLFQSPATAETPATPAPLTEKQIEDKLFDRVLEFADGNVRAIGTAVRKALNEKFAEFVGNKGRWIYLADKLTRRAVRTLRDTAAQKQNTRARA